MICQFRVFDERWCVCPKCGNKMLGQDPSRMYAKCLPKVGGEPTAPPPFECRHRGDALRTERNHLCGCIDDREAIYACQLHGECSLRKYRHAQRVRVCLGCDDQLTD